LNDQVMEAKINPDKPDEILLIGHSKVRSDGTWEEVKDEELSVKPIGLTPDEVMTMLTKYRKDIPRDLAHLAEKFDLSKLLPLDKLHFINTKLTQMYNPKLGVAAKELFPVQAAEAKAQKRPFSSHAFRALHANAAFQLYGSGMNEDVFFRDRLRHAGFGSVTNYKQVRLSGYNASSGGGGVDAELALEVGKLRSELNNLKEDMIQLALDQVNADAKIADAAGAQPARPAVVKKRKCPDVPAHLPIGPQTVDLVDVGGVTHTFNKFPRVDGLSLQDLQDRVDTGEAMLMSAGVPLKISNLRLLGIGARSVNLLWSGRRKALPNYGPQDYGREHQGESTCV